MKYEVRPSAHFKKDYKQAQKQGKNMLKLQKLIAQLANDEVLPESFRDHRLSGDYSGYSECHIEPDWLLIYKKEDEIKVLALARTGSHSNLF